MIDSAKLNDPDKIHDIQNMHPKMFEPLFWLLEDAIYRSDLQFAHCVYQDFLYLAQYRKSDLVKTLSSVYLKRLQNIAYELFEQQSVRPRQSIAIKNACSAKTLPFQKESELRDYLALHPNILADALQDKVRILDVEVVTDCEYRCDILAHSANFYYPIELKIHQANHAVVSQIHKYCYYFYRKYRYDLHKPIRGVVCANGFCSWSINELRREGIQIYDIVPSHTLISLEVIR
jgi:hypothetical protein